MFALGIVPAVAPGLKSAHQDKAKTYQVLARNRGTSDIQTEVNDIFGHAESGHDELVHLFSATLLRVLFCGLAPAIVQKITEIFR
jgi:hypothetical protein